VVLDVGRIDAEVDVVHVVGGCGGGGGGGGGQVVEDVTREVGRIEAEVDDMGTHLPHSQQYPGGQSASQVH